MDVFCTIVTTLLGIAFPLLLQATERIDSKYNSRSIVSLLFSLRTYRMFCVLLSINAILLLLITFCTDYGYRLKLVVELVETYLLLPSITSLIVLFALFCYKINSFYRTDKLIEELATRCNFGIKLYSWVEGCLPSRISYMLKNHVADYVIRQIDPTYIGAWTGLMRALIRSNEGNLIIESYSVLSSIILFLRRVKPSPVTYEDCIDKAVVEINSELCKSSERMFALTNSSDLLNCYSGADEKENSEGTNRIVWRCLSEQIYYNRNTMLYQYWKKAEQKCSALINSNSDNTDYFNQYIEFHIAFGAHLLYNGHDVLLSDILFYSCLLPPKYNLIPGNFCDLFRLYLKVSRPPYRDNFYFEDKYLFLNNNDPLNSEIERIYIQKYLALLCLRLKYIQPDYGTDQFRFNDEFEKTPVDIQRYINACESLLNGVKDAANSQKCNILFSKRAYEDKSLVVSSKIEEYLAYLREQLEYVKNNQPLSQEKIDSYKKSTSNILHKNIAPYNCMLHSELPVPECEMDNIVEKHRKGVYANNATFYNRFPSSYFKDGQEISVAGLDYTIAEAINSNLQHNIATTFSFCSGAIKSIYYNDISKALELLNPNSEKHIMLCFGYSIGFQTRLGLKLENSNSYKYKDVQVYLLPGSPVLSPFALFIRKSRMPKIEIKEPSNELKLKYGLNKIEEQDTYNIYWGLEEIDKNQKLKEWLLGDKNITEESIKQESFLTVYLYYYLYIPSDCIVGGFKLVDSFSSNVNDVDSLSGLPT